MNKLYGLYIVRSPGSNQDILACSNEIDKLTSVTGLNYFTIINDPNDKTLKQVSKQGEYPKYLIREIPYVC